MKKIIVLIIVLALGFSGCKSVVVKRKQNNQNTKVWEKKENITRFYTKSKEDKGQDFYLLSDEIEDPIAGIEVELIKKSGNAKEGYGIIFEFQDEKNYNKLLITAEGKYKWIEIIGGKEFGSEKWTNSKLLNKGYKVSNKIGVIYDEEKKVYNIFFNGVREEVVESEFLNEGKSGMFVSVSKNGYIKNEMIARIYNMMGKMYEVKGEIEEALECYKNAINKDPQNKKYKINFENAKN